MKGKVLVVKNFFIVLAGLSVVVCAIYAGSKMYKKNNHSSEQAKMDSLAEIIEDDCTEQWNELNSLEQENIQASSQESVRLSPKASVVYETKYEKCGHVSRQYKNITQDLVNKTERDINGLYPDWAVKEFDSNELVLLKSDSGECGEHYILRDVDGKVVVNLLNENGEEKEFEKTDISIEYLTDTDKIDIEKGLKVYGKENLSQIIEDYE